MAVTIKQVEAIPAGVDAAWQRIEAHIAHRFTARAVTWTVEGPGEWIAPLTPATISTSEIWNGTAWEAVTLQPGPLGLELPSQGPFRFVATVGGGTIPPAVSEAHSRLTAYVAAMADNTPGARSVSTNIPDVEQLTIEREPNWIARALQQSGAADLLRPYRKV